jgi:signal transduction histidine kinase
MNTRSTQDLVSGLLPRDVEVNNRRLILTRWIAVAVLVMATFISVRLFDIALHEPALYGLGGIIFIYNSLLTWYNHREEVKQDFAGLRSLIVIQVILDWVALTAFLHFTGGITSPALIFFLLHVTMVTILLPGQSPYLYATGVMLVITGLVSLEAWGILPHYNILGDLSETMHSSANYIFIRLVFLGMSLFATAFITASVMQPLRQRERQLLALFRTTHSVSASLEKNTVLQQLTTHVQSALDALGVTIRLLDRDGQSLRLVAKAGSGYRDDEIIKAGEGTFYRDVLNEQIRFVKDKHPAADIVPGTIEQVILVPIRGKQARGIISIYQTSALQSTPYLKRFLQAIADEGAIAIEHALAYEALQLAEKQRTQFVHVVTHELRSPVVGSQSMLRVLLANMGGALSDQQRDILERLNRRMDALLVLINDLLSLAEASALESQRQLEPVALNDALRDAINMFELSAVDKQQDLAVKLPAEPVYTLATSAGIKRILENLIGNAIKYTPEQGTISVSLKTADNQAVIGVEDTGIGIPEAALEKLGEEFYRAENARDSDIAGTGLGLATVKHLVDSFNGELRIDSTLGAGTHMCVLLPRHDANVFAGQTITESHARS